MNISDIGIILYGMRIIEMKPVLKMVRIGDSTSYQHQENIKPVGLLFHLAKVNFKRDEIIRDLLICKRSIFMAHLAL